MGQPEARTWSVVLDGRIQQITLEIRSSFWGEQTWTVIVNGSHAITSKPAVFGLKFKVGTHKCKVKAGTIFSGFAISLLIDDVDAAEYDSQRAAQPPQYAQPQPTPQTYVRDREVVYERQVVVVRCKHCGTLTPADLTACKTCGAQKFS